MEREKSPVPRLIVEYQHAFEDFILIIINLRILFVNGLFRTFKDLYPLTAVYDIIQYKNQIAAILPV